MKIETRRGHLTVLADSLELDWPFAKGRVACPDAVHHEALLSAAFDESLARGYVEEEASIHAAMACAMRPHRLWTAGAASHREAFPTLSLPHAPRIDPPAPFPRLANPAPGVYPVVDSQGLLETLLGAGAKIIQLRIKDLSTAEQANAVRLACRAAEHAPESQLFINDHWRAALDHGAFGIHLGQEDLLTADLTAIAAQGVRLGLSSHSYWEVARAMWLMPSYLACGPVFPTRAKAMNWIPQGLDNLAYWVSVSRVPVVAIAGIHAGNLEEIAATGADSAAVIQAIVSMPSPAAAYRDLQDRWVSAAGSRSLGPASQAAPHPETWPARPTLSPA